MMPFMTVFTYTHFTRKTILQFSMEVFLRAKKKNPQFSFLELVRSKYCGESILGRLGGG